MKKSKAIFVTAMLAAMTAAVWACLWRIGGVGFFGMTAFFAAIGFSGVAVNFFAWISKAPSVPVDKLELPELHSAETVEEPALDELTYEQIREEVEAL